MQSCTRKGKNPATTTDSTETETPNEVMLSIEFLRLVYLIVFIRCIAQSLIKASHGLRKPSPSPNPVLPQTHAAYNKTLCRGNFVSNYFLFFFLRFSLVQKGSSIAFAFSRRHSNSAKILLCGLAVTKLHVETRMVCKMIMMCLKVVAVTCRHFINGNCPQLPVVTILFRFFFFKQRQEYGL